MRIFGFSGLLQSAGIARETTVPLGVEAVCDLLRNRRRRRIVRYLAGTTGETTVSDLTEVLTVHEVGAEFTEADKKRIYVSVYQTHLPKLDDAGVVDFDKDTSVVTPTAATERIESVLDTLQDRCHTEGPAATVGGEQ